MQDLRERPSGVTRTEGQVMRWGRVLNLWRGWGSRVLADEDRLFVWIGVIFLGALGMAAAGTFATYHISARMTAAKDRELQQVQSEARAIEAASTDATQASARTADAAKSNTELQPKLQRLTRLKTSTGAGMQSSLLTPPASSPALIIALNPPTFLRPSDQPIRSDMETDNVPRAQ